MLGELSVNFICLGQTYYIMNKDDDPTYIVLLVENIICNDGQDLLQHNTVVLLMTIVKLKVKIMHYKQLNTKILQCPCLSICSAN